MADTFIRRANSEVTPVGESQPLSIRAFLLGTLLCLLIGVGTIYANAIIQGTFMAWCFSNPVALFLFFYLVLGNILVGTLARNLALRREELVLIYAMMMVSASIPTFGLVEHLLPMITGVFYYATPENNWGELIQPYVPAWIAPSDGQLIQGFYEGLPKGMPVPWEGWLETLGYWSVFLLALYLVSIGLMVLLRRPWMEGERLLYPMMQVPIEMINGREETSLVSAVFRQPQMWIGFALPVIVGCCNALHNYYPQWPGLYFRSSMYLFRDTINLPFEFSFSLVGFSYFINRNLALGIWFFYLLALVEQGCFNILGVHSTEKLGWFSNPSSPYLTHQALGAMLVFALYTLWKARSHLLAVARRAWRWGGDDGDQNEIMSYRAALWTVLVGLVVMVVWLEATGIPLVAVLLLVAVAMLIFIALSRIVAEAGVALVRAPLIAPDFVMASMGTSFLGPKGLTGLAYTYPWTADIVTFPMAACANSLKMIHEVVRGRKRAFFWGMVLALVVTLAGAFWIVLYLSYRHGGINLNSWFWLTSSSVPLSYISMMMRSPSTTELGGWLFTGFGAGLMWLLIWVHQRVMWWPIHPLGLAMTGTVFTSGVMWFNVFLAWAIKGLVLKYGGGLLYRQTRYFFVGMILGAFVVAGTWLVIDFITGKQGNFVLIW